jgi:spermidine/putrescine transport system substrate-binding protein
VSRRAFLRAAAGGTIGAALAACTPRFPPSPHADDLRFPRPDEPVRWKIYRENPPIEPSRLSEEGPLEVLSWDGYLAPDVLASFEEATGAPVVVSTFYDMNQAISKLRSGAVQPDVFVPTLDVLGRLIIAGLLQPLQHEAIPNLRHVWSSLQSPFYDVDSRYSVPYAIYSTGIGWRRDRAVDPGSLADPWSVFWDPAYDGKVFVLDDYRAAIQLALLAEGVHDINTEDTREIAVAGEALSAMSDATSVKWSLDDYTYLPEGRAWVHQAWSGDMVNAPYYGAAPAGEVAGQLGYWFPPDGRGEVNNDVLAVPAGARRPALAHRFIDHLLDPAAALVNYGWVGYQQPVDGLDRDAAIGLYPWIADPAMMSTFVSEEQLEAGLRQLELSPVGDALWQQAWLGFRSRG